MYISVSDLLWGIFWILIAVAVVILIVALIKIIKLVGNINKLVEDNKRYDKTLHTISSLVIPEIDMVNRYKKKKDSIALCLEYHCNGETKNYSVIIKGKEYRCNSKTDVISIKSENQEIAIECNDSNVICNNKYKCKFNR